MLQRLLQKKKKPQPAIALKCDDRIVPLQLHKKNTYYVSKSSGTFCP